MNPDSFKQAWQTQTSQTRLTINTELLLKEVRRNQRQFTATIFWGVVREVGVCLLLVPLLLYLGVKHSLPWTWYLAVPAVLWIAGYMLADRVRHKRQRLEPGDPLHQHVESSLAQLEHQIWLHHNVFWLYLLPFIVAVLAFFGQVAWQVQVRTGGWWAALLLAGEVAFVVIVFAGVYWLNQIVVHSELAPRRQELEALLRSLKDETPTVT
jgi:hypothetical protein